MTLALGLSLLASPVMARGGGGGGGAFRMGGGGGFHGGGGGFHGGRGGFHGGGFHGGGYHGGYYGGDGGYGDGYGYGYGGAAIGLGLLGAGIIASQEPYYSGELDYPQDGVTESPASCASRFHSYNPATGTYLGYDGLRHSCP